MKIKQDNDPCFIQTTCARDLQAYREFILSSVIPRTHRQDEAGQFDMDIVKRIHQFGLLHAAAPSPHQPRGMPLSDLVWVFRETGYGSGGLAATLLANVLGISPIVLFAREELRERLLRKIGGEFTLWSFAMTEAGAGSDVGAMATRAKKVDGGYVLSGEKNYITNINYCTDLCLFAALPSDVGRPSICCFYIPGDAEGLRRGVPYQKMGMRESNTGRFHLDEVFVPDEHLIGKEGDGLKILSTCLQRSKTLLSAICAGLSNRALDITIDQLTTTVRFNKPLIEQVAIRHQLARLRSQMEAAWLLTCQAASGWDQGRSIDLDAAMAKLIGSDTAVQVANECIELFGSKGFLADSEINRIFRDCKGFEIIEGPSLVQELLISKAFLSPSKTTSARKAA